jgi:uncharacterized Zn-finger protein
MSEINCKKIKCEYCTYTTKRKFDLKRHQKAKHKDNVIITENIVVENNTQLEKCNNMICRKCNKSYKTKKYLENHELNCNGITPTEKKNETKLINLLS